MIVNDGILWLMSTESFVLNDTVPFLLYFVHFLGVGLVSPDAKKKHGRKISSIVSSLSSKLSKEAIEVSVESIDHQDTKMINSLIKICY